MPVQIIFITAGMLLLSIIPLPFNFSELLRIVVSGTFAWGAYTNFVKKQLLLPLTYTVFALLYNPVMDIPLAKEISIPIALLGATLLLMTKKHIAG